MSVVIRDLTVTFKNNVTAVEHMDLTLEEGVCGLLGENGAGKTTLMRVLATLLTPGTGEVSLDGLYYLPKNFPQLRRLIGYLPQELGLYPNLTVRESLEYMGRLSGLGRAECSSRVSRYLERTGLTEHQKKKNRQLSGGMKRRVGLVQALLGEPKFLIIDEPTTGLDPQERIRIRNLIVEFSHGRTVLLSTHVVEDLAATCRTLAVLKKGKLLYTGTPDGLIRRAQGRVWLLRTADEQQAERLASRHPVVSRQYTQGGLLLRILSDERPDSSCEAAEATLEDAYILAANV